MVKLLKALVAWHEADSASEGGSGSGVRAWLEGAKADWLPFLDWLKVASLTPTLGANVYYRTRSPETAALLKQLARMSGQKASSLLKTQPKDSGMRVVEGVAVEAAGNLCVGPSILRREKGRGLAKAFICAQPVPCDGHLTHLNIMISSSQVRPGGTGRQWEIQVYDSVEDDLGKGGATDGTPVGDGTFTVGQRVSFLSEQYEGENLGTVLKAESDEFCWVVKDDGPINKVNFAFLSPSEEPLPERRALRLAGKLPIIVNYYMYREEKLRLHVPYLVKKGQHLGLRNKDGANGIAWSQHWLPGDATEHTYFFGEGVEEVGETFYRVPTDAGRPNFNFKVTPVEPLPKEEEGKGSTVKTAGEEGEEYDEEGTFEAKHSGHFV